MESMSGARASEAPDGVDGHLMADVAHNTDAVEREEELIAALVELSWGGLLEVRASEFAHATLHPVQP